MVVPTLREDKQKKWPERNIMKFSKGKCKVLCMVRNQYILRANDLESNFAEKDLRISGRHHAEHEPAMCLMAVLVQLI